MPTFVLKKYNQENNVNNETKELDNTTNQDTNNINNDKELTITVTGTVAEIVANALNKVFENKVEITKTEEDKTDSNIKAISTESVNSLPLDTFNFINKDDIVFIYNKGFSTAKEEWFLTNIENKTKNVFYTIESFIKFIKTKLEID